MQTIQIGNIEAPRAQQAPRKWRDGEQLTLYNDAPSGDVSIEDFEALALDRLRILKGLEEAAVRNKGDDYVRAKVDELITEHLKCGNAEETFRKDNLSHYILRLAYCRTDDLRAWCAAFRASLNTPFHFLWYKLLYVALETLQMGRQRKQTLGCWIWRQMHDSRSFEGYGNMTLSIITHFNMLTCLH